MITYNEAKLEIEQNSENILRFNEKVAYVTVTPFDDAVNEKCGKMNITYGFSTRLGGVSSGIFSEMNVGFKVGDDTETVLKNYSRLAMALGIDEKRISCPDQIHKTRIRRVSEKDAGNGIIRPVPEHDLMTDGQVTNVKNLPLIVYGADCVPIMAYDPEKNAIGTAHAGWRGTAGRIAEKLISKMQIEYNSNPSQILVVIGPSAGQDSYEVTEDVADSLKEMLLNIGVRENRIDEMLKTKESKDESIKKNMQGNSKKDIQKVTKIDAQKDSQINIQKNMNDIMQENLKKYMIDLWGINSAVLIHAGISEKNIFVSGLDTISLHEIFHSHRATNGKRGLNCGIIMLK